MNIFYLDEDPRLAAQFQCDKHVVKMVLESAQILSTVCKAEGVYRPTHKNHPCTLWAGSHNGNYEWLIEHAFALVDEYRYRYGKEHASLRVIKICRDNRPLLLAGESQPAQAMPENLRIPYKPVLAYRRYYTEVKMREIQCKWTKREKPYWVV